MSSAQCVIVTSTELKMYAELKGENGSDFVSKGGVDFDVHQDADSPNAKEQAITEPLTWSVFLKAMLLGILQISKSAMNWSFMVIGYILFYTLEIVLHLGCALVLYGYKATMSLTQKAIKKSVSLIAKLSFSFVKYFILKVPHLLMFVGRILINNTSVISWCLIRNAVKVAGKCVGVVSAVLYIVLLTVLTRLFPLLYRIGKFFLAHGTSLMLDGCMLLQEIYKLVKVFLFDSGSSSVLIYGVYSRFMHQQFFGISLNELYMVHVATNRNPPKQNKCIPTCATNIDKDCGKKQMTSKTIKICMSPNKEREPMPKVNWKSVALRSMLLFLSASSLIQPDEHALRKKEHVLKSLHIQIRRHHDLQTWGHDHQLVFPVHNSSTSNSTSNDDSDVNRVSNATYGSSENGQPIAHPSDQVIHTIHSGIGLSEFQPIGNAHQSEVVTSVSRYGNEHFIREQPTTSTFQGSTVESRIILDRRSNEEHSNVQSEEQTSYTSHVSLRSQRHADQRYPENIERGNWSDRDVSLRGNRHVTPVFLLNNGMCTDRYTGK